MTPYPYLQRHTRRTRLLWLLVAGAVFLLLDAPSAGAHQATLTVRTSCQQDGRWTASWRITNSEDGKVMDIKAEDVTAFAPNPTPFAGTSTDSTSHGNGVAQVTAHVTVDWVRHEPLDYELTAYRPEVCEAAPTTTQLPTTTTTVPPVGLIPPLVIGRPSPAVPVSATVRFTG